MARDLNLWVGIGRIGKELEIKSTPSGKKVCSTSIACSFDKATEWINLVFWEKNAEAVCQYCQKGSKISVTGRLQTRSWEHEGVKKYITEVVVNSVQFLDSKPAEQKAATPATPYVAPEDDPSIPF